MIFEYPSGATPLDANEKKSLIPPDIATQAALNQAEQSNIISAQKWALSRKRKNILSEEFLCRLHREMFKLVWRWAGKYRTTEKNIGVPPYEITTEVHKLIADCQYWIENKTCDWDELGARFHHRLVAIHLFPNGNGRHGRLATDVLLMTHGQKIFTWGEATFYDNKHLRENYITALREADQKNYQSLIEFVRS